MVEKVILVLKLKVNKDAVEEVREQIADFVNDFLDDSIAIQEGDVEELQI